MTTHYDTYRRYHLLVTRWFSVLLHVYYSDREIGFHPHPFNNLTIRLWGHFVESLITNYHSLDRGKETTHVDPRFVFRRATTAHKFKMLKGPLVTLFIVGKTQRKITDV